MAKHLQKIRRVETQEKKLREGVGRKLKDKSVTISSSMIRLDDLVDEEYDVDGS